MDSLFHIAGHIFNGIVFYYAAGTIAIYAALAFFSGIEIKSYVRKNKYVNYRDILVSAHAPSVSILIPFFNEAAIIIEKARQMLSLHYSNFEVIIINDGSSDNSLRKLINFYNLELVDYVVHEQIATNPIRGIYKSGNPAFSKLIVVDKANGGRCDALNAGINVSDKNLVLCLDINCLLEQDALLKMVKPFMEEGRQIIAAGAIVRSINPQDVIRGRIVKFTLPRGINQKFQVLRHLRTSLLRHMAWSRVNGLLQVSRAMALFQKEPLIKCGGYSPKCVENNAELIIRMKRFMADSGLPHRTILVPDPICWLPPPISFSATAEQYKNSVRGTIKGLKLHKNLFFNSSYQNLSISCLILFLSKIIAPAIEFFFALVFIGLAVFGYIDWQYFLIIASMIYLFSVGVSILAITYEELSFKYTSGFSLFKLFAAAILEPVMNYPVSLFWFATNQLRVVKPVVKKTPVKEAVVRRESQKASFAALPIKEPDVLPISEPDIFANCEIGSLRMANSEVLDE